jgi:hypothetical protein
MYKLDLSSKDKQFDDDLQNKVLREMCAGARQRKWKEDPDFTFIVKGVATTKKTNAAKYLTSANSKSANSKSAISKSAISNSANVNTSIVNSLSENSANVNSLNVKAIYVNTTNVPHVQTFTSSNISANLPDFINNTNFDSQLIGKWSSGRNESSLGFNRKINNER